jgi:hypothetical protein
MEECSYSGRQNESYCEAVIYFEKMIRSMPSSLDFGLLKMRSSELSLRIIRITIVALLCNSVSSCARDTDARLASTTPPVTNDDNGDNFRAVDQSALQGSSQSRPQGFFFSRSSLRQPSPAQSPRQTNPANSLSFAGTHVTPAEMLGIVAGALGRGVTMLDPAPSEPTIAVSQHMPVDDALNALETALANAGFTLSFDTSTI